MAKKKMTLEEKLEDAIIKDKPYEVPEKWLWTKLQYVANWTSGGTPKSTHPEYYDGDIPWLIIADMNDGEIYSSNKTITEEGLINSSAKIIDEESVLIAMYGSIGKLGITKIKCSCNQAIAFTKEIMPITYNKFIYYYLMFYRDKIISRGKGGTQQNISLTVLKDVEIVIPPLKEQQRIVDKIESLFEKLDKAKELIEEARDDFENRKKIILRDAFVGKLTRNYRSRNNFKSNAYDLIKDIRNELEQWYKEECITAKLVGNKKPRKLNFDIQKSEFEYLFKEIPLTWRVSYFQEIIEPVDNALKAGPFGSSLKKSMYVEKGYKIYGQEQVISGNISYGDYYINEEKFNELKSCEVREGDLLISLVGTIGKTLIMPKEYEKGIINPRLLKISVNKKISAEYIKMYFESPIAKYIMSEKSHGGTMEILNLDIIKKLPIPIPPIEEQIEIVRILDKIFEEESKIEELTQLEEQIELIKKSILAKAFRGQLGTNCEDDESAIELLKEILNK